MKSMVVFYIGMALLGVPLVEAQAASSFYDTVHNVTRYCSSFGCSSCFGTTVTVTNDSYNNGEPYEDTAIECTSCETGYEPCGVSYSLGGGRHYHYTACCESESTPSFSCPENCSLCSSSTWCTGCNSGYTLNNGTCVKCPENCFSCRVPIGSTSASTCDTCNNGYILKNGQCVLPGCIQMSGSTCIACDEGYVLDNGKCLKCPDGCKSCSNSLACKTCADGYFMMTAVCYPNGHAVCRNDGKSFDGGVCLITCVESETDFFCRKATCTTASGSVQRTKKQTNFTQGTYHEYCCPANCAECSDWEQCTKCNDGYTLQNGVCLDCSVYNVGNGTCTECDEYGCTDAECNGSNAFFNPTFRKCGVECDANQYLDSSYTCRDCPAGQTSSGGWFANPTDCYSCDSIPVDGGRCTECKNGSCTKAECEDGYVLDSMGRTCIAALASCLSPLKISDDGCCCVK